MNQSENVNGLMLPLRILRVVILLQCVGLLGLYLLSGYETESDLFELLLFDWGQPEPLAQAIDDWGAMLAAGSGAVVAVMVLRNGGGRPSSGRVIQRHGGRQAVAAWLDRLALVFLTAWFFAMALAEYLRGGPYSQLALGEHAVRYLAPLALLVLLIPLRNGVPDQHWAKGAVWILRVAAAATFATHGYKAIQSYGPFLDLILLSELRWTPWLVSEKNVTLLLSVIGWIDVLIAAIVLTRWWPAAAFYMTVWGIVTAFSRMTALGADYWPASLVRAANGGVPFVLLTAYWLERHRSLSWQTAPPPQSLEANQ